MLRKKHDRGSEIASAVLGMHYFESVPDTVSCPRKGRRVYMIRKGEGTGGGYIGAGQWRGVVSVYSCGLDDGEKSLVDFKAQKKWGMTLGTRTLRVMGWGYQAFVMVNMHELGFRSR